MTPITDARVLEIALKFNFFDPGSLMLSLRGDAVLAFARALLAEHEGGKIVPPLTECADNDSPWLVCKPCVAAGVCRNSLYVGQPSPGASISLPQGEGSEPC